jgi:hypothetical protein
MGEWQHPKVRSMSDRQAESNALAARRLELNRRLRLAFIAGAEERSRDTAGRGLTDEELERIIERYPGDVKDRSRSNPARRRVADSRDAPS